MATAAAAVGVAVAGLLVAVDLGDGAEVAAATVGLGAAVVLAPHPVRSSAVMASGASSFFMVPPCCLSGDVAPEDSLQDDLFLDG